MDKAGVKPRDMVCFWNLAPDSDYKAWGIEWLHHKGIPAIEMSAVWKLL